MHPDKNLNNPEAGKLFIELNAAYHLAKECINNR